MNVPTLLTNNKMSEDDDEKWASQHPCDQETFYKE